MRHKGANGKRAKRTKEELVVDDTKSSISTGQPVMRAGDIVLHLNNTMATGGEQASSRNDATPNVTKEQKAKGLVTVRSQFAKSFEKINRQSVILYVMSLFITLIIAMQLYTAHRLINAEDAISLLSTNQKNMSFFLVGEHSITAGSTFQIQGTGSEGARNIDLINDLTTRVGINEADVSTNIADISLVNTGLADYITDADLRIDSTIADITSLNTDTLTLTDEFTQISFTLEATCRLLFYTSYESWRDPSWTIPTDCGTLGPMCIDGTTAFTNVSQCFAETGNAVIEVEQLGGTDTISNAYASRLEGNTIELVQIGTFINTVEVDFTDSLPAVVDTSGIVNDLIISSDGAFTIIDDQGSNAASISCSGREYALITGGTHDFYFCSDPFMTRPFTTVVQMYDIYHPWNTPI